MFEYLLKRLALIVVTWFGISLICFTVMTMAPGDPAAMKAQSLARGRAVTVSEFVLRKNRELFNLDRPRLFNPSPANRASTTRETLVALRAKEKLERDDARARLVGGIGTAGLDLMIAELPAALERARTAREERRALLAALRQALPADGAAPSPEAQRQLLERLQALGEALPQFTPRLGGGSGGRGPDALARAKAWLAQEEVLLRQAEDDPRSLLEVLAAVVGGGAAAGEAGARGPELPADASLEQAAQAWQTWWTAHQADYAPERVEAAVRGWLSEGEIPAADGAPPGSALAALDRVGTLAAPALMTAYRRAGEGTPAERQAAWGLSRVCRKPWDLTTSPAERQAWEVEWTERKAALEAEAAEQGMPPEALARRLERLGDQAGYVAAKEQEELELHRYRWSDWWYRAEEQYVDFSAPRQLLRAFTQTQFGRWMGRFLKFDFGESYQTKRPVSEMLLERFPRTLTLEAVSIFLAYLVAIPLGVYSATHQGGTGDRVSTVVLFLLYSIPSFWAGAMCILLLTGNPDHWWTRFPAYHFSSLDADKLTRWEQMLDVAHHLILPVLVLTYGQVAYISRLMRSGMLDAIRQDYVRTARAKGLPEGVVVYKHALRNALIPILTLLGSTLPVLVAGSVITETVFTIDGLGKMFIDAMEQRDYPVIMASLVISALLTLVGYLLSDIGYAVVDPRIEFR